MRVCHFEKVVIRTQVEYNFFSFNNCYNILSLRDRNVTFINVYSKDIYFDLLWKQFPIHLTIITVCYRHAIIVQHIIVIIEDT